MICHPSPFTCHLSPVTSPRPTATATDPPPANSPTSTVGWFTKTEPKIVKLFQNNRYFYHKKNRFSFALFDQKSPDLSVLVGNRGDNPSTTQKLTWQLKH